MLPRQATANADNRAEGAATMRGVRPRTQEGVATAGPAGSAASRGHTLCSGADPEQLKNAWQRAQLARPQTQPGGHNPHAPGASPSAIFFVTV